MTNISAPCPPGKGWRANNDHKQAALDFKWFARSDGLSAAASATRQGADKTAGITRARARAGRASYLSPDKLKGHNNPGAEAVARLFEQLQGVEW